MTFSIIIPIYKVEKYLCECVDSVLSQTFTDYEIILVDDGSPDNCPKICDDYAQNNSSVKVIHKTNGGLSDARNIGLENACGEYVIFLDSDDFYLDNLFLEKLYCISRENHPDAIFFQRTIIKEGNEKAKVPSTPYSETILTESDPNYRLHLLSQNDKLDANASRKCTKKDILINNCLFFTKGIYSEDVEWYCRYLPAINSFELLNEPSYCYRKRSGSITNSKTAKNVYDIFLSIEKHAERIRLLDISDNKKMAILNYLSYQYYIIIGMASFLLPINERFKFLQSLSKYKWLMKYSNSKKTKKSAKLINLVGIYISSYILGLYIKHK